MKSRIIPDAANMLLTNIKYGWRIILNPKSFTITPLRNEYVESPLYIDVDPY
jgi:hypothetical protein